MFKKAGIVVGVSLVAISGLLYWVAFGLENKEEEVEVVNVTSSSTASTGATGASQDVTYVQEVASVESNSDSFVASKNSTTSVETQKMVFQELESDSLGEPVSTSSEIMVVSRKKVVMMDSNYGEKDGKHLAYAVELLSGGNRVLTLYLNGVAYDSLSLNDRLQVEYSIYKNDIGVEFPVVISAEKTQ